jgi:type II secretory pathway component PulC
MKKFAPLFLCVISLVGLVMVSFGFLKMKFSPMPPMSSMSIDAQYNKEFADANQRISTNTQMLSRLSNLGIFSLGNLTAPLAGNSPEVIDPKAALGKFGSGLTGSKPVAASTVSPISMIYVSNNMSRVVMNGNTYSVGDRLPGGANLVEINLDSIITETKGRRQKMKAPQAAVVGSTQKLKPKEEIQ